MNDKACGHQNQICWGKLIAGAAIVAGAALFAPGVMTVAGDILGGIGSAIAGMFGSSASMGVVTKELLARAAGATLLGGGIAYFMSKKDTPVDPHEYDEGFALNEKMRFAQAQMMTRLAHSGHPQAAMQPGRG